MKISALQNKSIAILGYGIEGKSTYNFLLKHNIDASSITILDAKGKIPEGLEDSESHFVVGEMYLDSLGDFDVIIKTPGISPYHEKIINYKDKLTSQTEIFFSNYTGKVIGVTATKGKSTTVSVLHEALDHAGCNVKLVGNIGSPVLSEIDILGTVDYDYIIYELSSYMLEGYCPPLTIGVLGNIFRCHVDWHNNTYATYREAKLNILTHAEHKIAGSVTQDFLEIHGIDRNNITFFGLEGEYSFQNNSFYKQDQIIGSDNNISLAGEHNRVNIAGVLAVLGTISEIDQRDFGELTQSLFSILESFESLPHRIQNIGTHKGIRFIDDSIATTPDATLAAIQTFHPHIGCIFLGGFDYGFEFSEFAQRIKEYKIQNIVFFPNTGADIKKELDKIGYTSNNISTKSMKEAVEFAYAYCKSGEIALLSCASPSFSMYENYKERAYDFKREVEQCSEK